MKVRNFERFFSENAPLQGYSGRLMHSRPFLSLRKIRMRIIFDHVFCFSFGEKTSDGLQFCMPPSKVCPQCETKAKSVLLVSAVQGFCCFCSLPYSFRYVFVNACASSSRTCKNSLAHPRPNILVLFHCWSRVGAMLLLIIVKGVRRGQVD